MSIASNNISKIGYNNEKNFELNSVYGTILK